MSARPPAARHRSPNLQGLLRSAKSKMWGTTMRVPAAQFLSWFLGTFTLVQAAYCYDVRTNGSFNYSINIAMPPAPAKHQPALKLVYNSDSKGENFGRGWSLAGLPTIRRIDFGDGIHFAGNDTFWGAEGRLVKVATSQYRFTTDNGSIVYPIFAGDSSLLDSCYVSNHEPCAWKIIDRFGTSYDIRAAIPVEVAKMEAHRIVAVRHDPVGDGSEFCSGRCSANSSTATISSRT
jgi:hypothetical protein